MTWRTVNKLETGETEIRICREFNFTPRVVFNLTKQFQNTAFKKPRQGLSRATTTREDSHLSIIARHNRYVVALRFSHEFLASDFRRVLYGNNQGPAFCSPRNRPIWQWRLDGLRRHHVGWLHTPPCL
ncbi:HTH_Tnp_Tc3_2 domain-containing protein [Trichonephila clavipes]|nr:HTH_Tnp_Tc3_2 domain-containing protein [Trichonephila clavipes]